MTNYTLRMNINVSGDNSTIFTSPTSKEIIAVGYNRVVVGVRGPYIEFEHSQIYESKISIPSNKAWKIGDPNVYYLEYRTDDNIKVYYQMKTVAYADYVVGKFYISPFDILADDEVIIEPLRVQENINSSKFF